MIRLAAKSDIEYIARMEKLYIECAWTQNMLLDAYDNGSYTFLADDEKGELAGYIFLKTILDEAEICNIAIQEKYRRQGRAERLISAAENYCKNNNAKTVFLEVNERNEAAIKLYAKCGYEKIALRKNYYAGGGSAAVMRKIL